MAARALTVDPGGAARAGVYVSMAMVDGHPAIAYSNSGNSAVKYVRALDDRGSAWGAPVVVEPAYFAGFGVTLRVINGNPAVCYHDAILQRIKYVRATDAAGSAWGNPVLLDSPASMNGSFGFEVVNGNPALSFTGSSGQNPGLMYVRATDVNGAAWGPAVMACVAGDVVESCMKVVEGHPAIVFSGAGAFRYVRAADPSGAAWSAPVDVASSLGHPGRRYLSMQLVNNRPAIGYFDGGTANLTYVRAVNSSGTVWGAPVTLDTVSETGHFASLAVVNGKPTIGYYAATSRDLKFVQALDSDGATPGAWGPPVTVDRAGSVGMYASLLEVGGRPALAYYDESRGSLDYVSAVGSGITQWPAELVVEEADRSAIPRRSLKDFGIVPVGTTKWSAIILKNPNSGSAPFTGISAKIDGPHASEFHVTVPPAESLPAGHTNEFSLIYSPVTPGLKFAELHITTLTEGVEDSYDITLTGSSQPDLMVIGPSGLLVDTGILFFPITPPGSPRDISFTVRNPGGAELHSLVCTFDGPDAGEYSVSVPPASSVAPGGSTSFTVRHSPLTVGSRTATLHLASNVAGTKNPFDLTLTILAGTRDNSFSPAVEPVQCFALQGDGKIVAGVRNTLAIFHPGGGPDLAFFSPVLDGVVNCITVPKDGGILIGGSFQRVDGRLRFGLARLHVDGLLDETFAPAAPNGEVRCMAVQPDGKILLGGRFGSGAAITPFLVRLNSDGSREAGFSPVLDGRLNCLALQPDGKILVGGSFETGQNPGAGILRFNPDGTPDAFPAAAPRDVTCLAVQSDGRIYAGGIFDGGLVRLLPDGARDPSMILSTTGGVYDLALQADGKCLAAGLFHDFDGIARPNLARINTNGTLDVSFDPLYSAGIAPIALQSDGKVLVGNFLGDLNLPGTLARLENDPAPVQLKIEGASTLRWLRSGAAPEVSDVSFEVKLSGSEEWTLLGKGKRIPGGWELTGLTLPASGSIRAQGCAEGSLIETARSILPPLASWRLQHFGSIADTGDAADDADPDQDGLTNFAEFAFGLSPVDSSSNALPAFTRSGDSFTASFTAPAGTEDLIYGAEWSSSLLPGSWTSISDTGTAPIHTFSAPAAGERAFVRFVLKIR